MADESTIIGVLIGGAFALAGTLVGSAISLWNSRAERKERRWEHVRNRLEEAADLTSKSVEWIIGIGACKTLDELRPFSLPPPTRRLYMLCTLYFPSVESAATEYHNELIRYYQLASDSVGSGMMTVGAEMTKSGISAEASAKLRRLRQKLDDALAAEMKHRATA
ncbi:MAG: hypothetical protein ABL994_17850 [Verrucomicrobiales bacterium]